MLMFNNKIFMIKLIFYASHIHLCTLAVPFLCLSSPVWDHFPSKRPRFRVVLGETLLMNKSLGVGVGV